jgi:hypothetical protein
MASLVAWVKVTQKKRLRVIDVDADQNPALLRTLAVDQIPALVLNKDRRFSAGSKGGRPASRSTISSGRTSPHSR